MCAIFFSIKNYYVDLQKEFCFLNSKLYVMRNRKMKNELKKPVKISNKITFE